MKLFKLSLVAAIAAGALATSANAVALEEAIKDVDVSGWARIRYEWNKNSQDDQGQWNFKSIVNVKNKIDDSFFSVVSVRYNGTDSSMSQSTSSNQNKFDIYQGYLGYSIGGTTVMAGRQKVGAFWTDDMYGDGIKVLNQDIEGLTLAALWMDALEADSDIELLSVNVLDNSTGDDIKTATGKRITDHNLYGVAAIGSYDPVSFQIWYAQLQDVTDLFVVELGTNFQISDDVTLGLKGQYGFTDLDSGFKNVVTRAGVTVDDSQIWAIEASTEFFGVDAAAGYVNYSADSNAYSLSSFEDWGSFISAGELLNATPLYFGANHYWFITAGYTIPDTGLRFGLDYLNGEADNTPSDLDTEEWVGRVSYKYNKKLQFSGFYSHYTAESSDSKDTQQRVRFDAKYSF